MSVVYLVLIHYSRTLIAVTKVLISSFASFSFTQLHSMLSDYLSRLSVIVDSKLNCGPVLTWMEVRRAHGCNNKPSRDFIVAHPVQKHKPRHTNSVIDYCSVTSPDLHIFLFISDLLCFCLELRNDLYQLYNAQFQFMIKL